MIVRALTDVLALDKGTPMIPVLSDTVCVNVCQVL